MKNEIVFCCGIDDSQLMPALGRSLYLRCPKYEFKNRRAGEKVCMNRLSLKEIDIMYDSLKSLQEENALNIGTRGRINGISYEIADKKDDYIKVWVINHKKTKY